MDLKCLGYMVLFLIRILYYILKASVCLLQPSRRRTLTEEVVLITGGGRGIGRHLAQEFAKQRAKKVILWGRTEKCLKETCEEIAQSGTECHYFLCDRGQSGGGLQAGQGGQGEGGRCYDPGE
ncbi:hypothetical protein J4Q44_G00103200 [Coregonus suidteri]|uniref:Uncharacterized protein n=1 Tax=Coregonus suidteri TaxID=861788 RepID=A0AAN8LZD5_9TELE